MNQLSLSLMLGSGGKGAPLWTPAQLTSLYAAPIIRDCLNAGGKLWQDAAKTTAATADGHPVRVIVCSYTAKEFTAPSDAARGTLRISGTKAWIELDGVDDYYTFPGATISTGASSVSAFDKHVANPNFMDLDTYNLGQGWESAGGASYPSQFRATRINAQPNVADGNHVITTRTRTSPSEWKRRLDGTQDISTTHDIFSGDATWKWGFQPSAVVTMDGELYGLFITTAYMTDAEVTSAESYMNGLFP